MVRYAAVEPPSSDAIRLVGVLGGYVMDMPTIGLIIREDANEPEDTDIDGGRCSRDDFFVGDTRACRGADDNEAARVPSSPSQLGRSEAALTFYPAVSSTAKASGAVFLR
jgi:hypothetical protein